MAQRNLLKMSSDEIYASWQADIETIKQDAHELFSLRRTFRDISEVFRANPRLQEVGWHLWDWMRINYASSVLIRIRREIDKQPGSVNLNRLLTEIKNNPTVLTRKRWQALPPTPASPDLARLFDETFTRVWVGQLRLRTPDGEHVAPEIVENDLRMLRAPLKSVALVAHSTLAHRTRLEQKDLTIPEVDAAFDAIEETLQKYYTLLVGPYITQVEPTRQFNTHEVYTFPWMEIRR